MKKIAHMSRTKPTLTACPLRNMKTVCTSRAKCASQIIMVVGAGAIGNELIKNLALLGIGRILIFDMDDIENTNLTRSVLYRCSDVGRYKAEVAAERAMEMNPDVKAKAFVSNIIDDVGLGVFRRMNEEHCI